jgi:hypothetical protein
VHPATIDKECSMTTRARSALRLRGTLLALALFAVLAVAVSGAASASASTATSPSSASAAQSSVAASPAASQTTGAAPTKKPFVNWKWLALGLGGTLILLVGMWFMSRRIKPKETK